MRLATRIVVPDAGQTTDELLLAKWHVKVGDEVEVGDFLADIETDKAVTELESYVAGHVLRLMVEEGDTITTGQTLLWIGAPGEAGDEGAAIEAEPETTPQTSAPKPADEPSPDAAGSGVIATPAARTLSREQGLRLADIAGTGPGGGIVKRDVVAAAGRLSSGEGDAVQGRAVPLSGMRRAIAARLQESVRQAPHFYVAIEVDMTQALAARRAAGTRVTVTDLIVKAAADTLAECPRLNCRLEDEAIQYLADINIGIAVSVEDGVVVPVLAQADKLSLAEVAEQSRRLTEGARAGRLPAGVRGSFTVSSLGMYGPTWFSAIINPPEVAILAVGAIHDTLVLTETGVAAVPTLTLTLSSDHRVVDGVLAARFLKALKDRLETWQAPPSGPGLSDPGAGHAP